MPYALFCNEAKLSKTYPTEADVWKLARQSGLVIDFEARRGKPTPRPVLDNDYEIKPCRPDPLEDPVQNQAEAERQAGRELQFISQRMALLSETSLEDVPGRAQSEGTAAPEARALHANAPREPQEGIAQRARPLRRRDRERRLLGGKRNARPLAMQTSNGTRDLQHLACGTRCILHEGDLIGRKHQRFGSQDGLSRARKRYH